MANYNSRKTPACNIYFREKTSQEKCNHYLYFVFTRHQNIFSVKGL